MRDDLMHEILCLAERVDPDSEAVPEWFFETPLLPHGKTARELVQADQADQADQGAEVIACVTRILHDTVAESTSWDQSPPPGAASATLGHDAN